MNAEELPIFYAKSDTFECVYRGCDRTFCQLIAYRHRYESPKDFNVVYQCVCRLELLENASKIISGTKIPGNFKEITSVTQNQAQQIINEWIIEQL